MINIEESINLFNKSINERPLEIKKEKYTYKDITNILGHGYIPALVNDYIRYVIKFRINNTHSYYVRKKAHKLHVANEETFQKLIDKKQNILSKLISSMNFLNEKQAKLAIEDFRLLIEKYERENLIIDSERILKLPYSKGRSNLELPIGLFIHSLIDRFNERKIKYSCRSKRDSLFVSCCDRVVIQLLEHFTDVSAKLEERSKSNQGSNIFYCNISGGDEFSKLTMSLTKTFNNIERILCSKTLIHGIGQYNKI